MNYSDIYWKKLCVKPIFWWSFVSSAGSDDNDWRCAAGPNWVSRFIIFGLVFCCSLLYYIIHASLSRIQKRSSHILHNYTVYRAILSIKQRVITSFYPLTPYGNWASDRSFRWRNGESLGVGVAMEASIRVPQHTAIMWCVPQKEKCWAAAILPQQEENSKVLEYIYIQLRKETEIM